MSSDSPVYQVHYFKARGRGEVARILLEVAGANWTNVFIGTEAAPWPESKGNYAYGQVPGLKIINSGIFSFSFSFSFSHSFIFFNSYIFLKKRWL
ncbi:MAG: hypothetical protein Q8P67_17460 [archaeon]|nr:hypothetical protein [archaeon]